MPKASSPKPSPPKPCPTANRGAGIQRGAGSIAKLADCPLPATALSWGRTEHKAFDMRSPLVALSKFDYFGVLLLRVGAGMLVAYHGFPALSGGQDAWREIGSGAAIAALPPFLFVAAGLTSAVIQVLGGLSLILGLFTRGAALLLAIVSGFALANIIEQRDFTLTFFAYLQFTLLFLGLAFIGPGRLSIDRKGV